MTMPPAPPDSSPAPEAAPRRGAAAAALPLGEALASILTALRSAPPPAAETVALHEAADRVLAADVAARIAVPAHDNAAMDGYAFAAASLAASGETVSLRCIGRALAGRPFGSSVGIGEAVRIMTGAAMPDGTDSVVPIERVQAAAGGDAVPGSTVRWARDAVRPGANRRQRGEDLAPGQLALQAGTRLRAAQIGLLASLGEATVSVHTQPRVAVFSSGDELVPPGAPLPPGCIHDSNRAVLATAARRLGAQVMDLGWVPDDPAALDALLERAVAEGADLVLTSGGISVGDADHTRRVLERRGGVDHWQLALRPGRPFVFGRLHGREAATPGPWIMALPGNPVASLVAFYALVRPAILALSGAGPAPPPALAALCTEAIAKRPGRSEFPRGVLAPQADGRWTVRPVEAQGAAMLRGVAEANAFIVLEHDRGPVAAGEWVPVWAFEGLV